MGTVSMDVGRRGRPACTDRRLVSAPRTTGSTPGGLTDTVRTAPHCIRELRTLDPAVFELREWSRMADDLTDERCHLANPVPEQLWCYYARFIEIEADSTLALWQLAPTPDHARRADPLTIAKLLKKHRLRRMWADSVPVTLRTDPITVASVRRHRHCLLPTVPTRNSSSGSLSTWRWQHMCAVPRPSVCWPSYGELATCQRLGEWAVRHVAHLLLSEGAAIVVRSREFGHLTRRLMRVNAVVRPFVAALESNPQGFHAVDMGLTAHMFDRTVRELLNYLLGRRDGNGRRLPWLVSCTTDPSCSPR